MNEGIDQTLSLSISGPAMDIEGGYELNYLTDTLNGFESIVEKTYLFSTGRSRMNEDDRENLKIVLKNPRKGSFQADIIIQLYDLSLALVPYAIENGPAIWTAIKNTYEYLKLVIDTKKKGKEISVSNNGDGVQVVVIGNENSTYTFPPYVTGLAEKIAPEIEKITSNIDDDKIDKVSFEDEQTDETIELSSEDKERFATKTYLTPELYTLSGQITVSNSKTFSGRILIYENEYDIEPGEYPFTVDPPLANKTFFKEKFLINENYICRLKTRLEPAKGLEEVIIGINLVSTKD